MSQTFTPRAPSRPLHIVAWVLQVLLAAVFFAAGIAKLTGAEAMVQSFELIGLGQGFRIITGLVEVVGAIGLVIPGVAAFAALWLAATMVGATAAHLLVLPSTSIPALLLLALCLAVAWLRRQRLIAFVSGLRA